MGRFFEWTTALEGIGMYMRKEGITINQTDRKEEFKQIRKFCRRNNFKGSNTDKILYVSNNFAEFKKFLFENISNEIDVHLEGFFMNEINTAYARAIHAYSEHSHRPHSRGLTIELEQANYDYKNACYKACLNHKVVSKHFQGSLTQS